MAKILVEIPDDLYNEIKQTQMFISGMRSGKTLLYTLMSSVANGAQIQKGHGRLIDENNVIEWLKDKDIIKMSYQENNARKDMQKSIPTIIEADKEGKK